MVLLEEKPAGGQTYQWFYDHFVSKLRELSKQKDLIISGAPECHHGCPDNYNPMEQVVNLTRFDYLL